MKANEKIYWTICPTCHGTGKTLREPSRKRYRLFQIELENFEKTNSKGTPPQHPIKNMDVCVQCMGSGLSASKNPVQPDSKKYPHIAIIGGGIGGVALAVGCLHRGIPFSIYERDKSFDARSQGYGLTLQQASNAIKGLGIFSLDDGITSTRHIVFNPEGMVIGEWGFRKSKKAFIEKTTKRKNVHIARQKLRSLLLQELGDTKSLKWGHTLIGISNTKSDKVNLTFQVGEQQETTEADLVVGADGIRSVVQDLIIGEQQVPLRYLGCIVLLGICPLKSIDRSFGDIANSLLDSATVFQTVNGHERIYLMPYDKDTIMWQLSFPLPEADAKHLSKYGAQALKQEALRRLGTWHNPIPQILAATRESEITGYPVYDRTPFDPTLLQKKGNVTLLGDAVHPMSPFKGQGANQALLDALMLARKISLVCDQNPQWRELGIRKSILTQFEQEMARRSSSKVKDSAKAVEILHSPAVLQTGHEPRGRGLNTNV